MAVRYKDDRPVQTKYGEPIVVVKYVHDIVVVKTWFGAFVLSPTSVVYIENGKHAAAKIDREGGKLRFEPQNAEDEIAFGYLLENLPPQLRRKGDKIYLDEAEVATIYELT